MKTGSGRSSRAGKTGWWIAAALILGAAVVVSLRMRGTESPGTGKAPARGSRPEARTSASLSLAARQSDADPSISPVASSPPGGSAAPRALSGSGPGYVAAKELEAGILRQGAGHAIIRGNITTQRGRPIPGASITLYSSMDPRNGRLLDPLVLVVSDANGAYETQLDFSLTVWLAVSKAGFAQIQEYLEVDAPGIVNRNYRMREASASLDGRVLGSDGRPVAGAWVSITFPSAARTGVRDETSPNLLAAGRDGSFRVDGLPAGQVAVAASARGHMMDGRGLTLSPGEHGQLELRLPVARTVSFAVKDRSGKPIPAASAKVADQPLFFMADDAGIVAIDLPPDVASFGCTVGARGYSSVTFNADTDSPPKTVVLDDGDVLRGQVVSETGDPLSGAKILVVGRGGRSGQFEGSTLSGENGGFSWRLSNPPVWKIFVTKPGYIDEALAYENQPAPEFVRARLRRVEGGIYGRVFDEQGRAAESFDVFVQGVSAAVAGRQLTRSFGNPEGTFAIVELPAGTYRLKIQSLDPATQAVLSWRSNDIEVRKGLFFGEIVAELRRPPTVTK